MNKLVHFVLDIPIPTTPTGYERMDVTAVCSSGIGALFANLYLAITNGAGMSAGKALTGLRLIVLVGHYPARPGFMRGLVRSALQAGQYMGAVMLWTGWHDTIAGTKIIQLIDEAAWKRWWVCSKSLLSSDARFTNVLHAPRIATSKIAMSVFLHLFFAMIYAVLSAI